MTGWLIIIVFLALCVVGCATVVVTATMQSSRISRLEEERRD